MKIKREKKHYCVYYVGRGTGCYAKEYQKTFLGETWAVSEEKACNNVRYRHRDKNYKHGGYKNDYLDDCLGEGDVIFTYEAIEIWV